MLYLLFVLTFLCGILFYGLSPSDKKLDETAHQAEGMISSFLAQHQAAKDYLYTWLGAGPKNPDPGHSSNIQSDGFLKPEFEEMMPRGITSDMCEGNIGTPGDLGKESCFVSRVICTNADGTSIVDDCNTTGSKRYVVTYGGWNPCTGAETGHDAGCTYKRPDWWPSMGQRMRRFESWRKAIATRTRGSISCGTLFENEDNNWCIDNGQTAYKDERAENKTCMTQVPSTVINALPYNGNALNDLLFCMSEFKQGVGEYYPEAATYFYDGLANASVGQHLYSSGPWPSLTDTKNLTANPFTWTTEPYITGELNTALEWQNSFTLTVLVQAYAGEAIGCPLLRAGTIDVFTKLPGSDRVGDTPGRDAVQLWNIDKSGVAKDLKVPICNANSAGNNVNTVSWTIVVKGNSVEVYENAALRLSETLVTTPSTGDVLTLGGTNARIYGIRYYNSALGKTQILKNFKVDQKRFGIPDANNGQKDIQRSVQEALPDIVPYPHIEPAP